MASSINASTSAGVVTTADTSGVLNIQTAGTTAISIDASQAVSFTNQPTYSGGTANGVAYLNGSKVLTTGSALTFDGTNLTVNTGTVSATYGKLTVAGGISITPDSSSKFQIGRYSAGAPYSYIKMGSTSSGLKFTDPADSVDLATLDSAGNLGLGVTPSAWTFSSLSIGGQAASFAGDVNTVYAQANAYYNAGWKYVGTGYAGQYQIDRSVTALHKWFTAPSGTAGNAISFTQAMTLDASGNLGVGTTSPSNRLHVTGSNGDVVRFAGATKNLYLSLDTSGYGLLSGSNQTGSGFYVNDTSSYVSIYTNSAERARIDSSGNLLVGTTSVDATSATNCYIAPGYGYWYRNSTATQAVFNFRNPNGYVGSIQTSGSATAFNTSSDYRLKENVTPMTGALAVVSQLRPVNYTWKVDGTAGQGFIAHELAEIVPQCVSGEKDAVNEDGSIKPQGIDTSFLVATLTAAIKEQQAIIQSLTDRLTALENK